MAGTTAGGRFSRACRVATAGALLLAGTAARAQSATSPALDRIGIWLGGYYANTTLKLDAQADQVNVDTGEVRLAHGHESIARARVDLLLFDRQGLTFDWYALGNSSSRQLTRTFTYEGVPFVVDSTLHGHLDFRSGSAAWHWWFGDGADVVGIGVGAVWYRLGLDVRGTVALEDIRADGAANWSDSAVAPLLNVAWRHAFSNDLRAYVDLSGVRKNGGRLSGHVHDARVGLEWFPSPHLGVGVEYAYTRITLNRRTSSYAAGLGVDLDGPALFARMRF